MLALRTELTFAQLWAKSGLGLEPSVLGVGPLDEDATAVAIDDSSPALGMKPIKSNVLALGPTALPLEFDRLETEGQALQTSLGEMLEYFHDAALLLSNTPSVRPVTHAFLTSPFGKRSDPMNHSWAISVAPLAPRLSRPRTVSSSLRAYAAVMASR